MNFAASAPVRQPAPELPDRGGAAPPSLQPRGEGEEFQLLRSLFSTANETISAAGGNSNKPGNRTAGMDLNYRHPGLRNCLTFYADGYTDDQVSPVAYADRSAWRAGLYLTHFPLVRKLDLRVEGVYTDNPIGGAVGHGFYYLTWRSGCTNHGDLIGSWVGRERQGAQAWGTDHWLFPEIQRGAQKDVAASLQIAFQPQSLFQRRAKSSERTTTGDGGHP